MEVLGVGRRLRVLFRSVLVGLAAIVDASRSFLGGLA